MAMSDDGGALPDPIQSSLQRLLEEMRSLEDGTVATYIPELGKADPSWLGICLVTANGSVYEAGDTRIPFTIQSISKPFVYGLALEDHGRAGVLERVGVEPTGDAFNSISLEPNTGRPRNPMINAGAITTTGLVSAKSPESRFRRILDSLGAHAGRELELDEAVYRSERDTGHRNRAIGHLLRNFGMLDSDPDPVVDVYFRQCSILVTCRDLAVMAATLANRGLNPLTGRQALRGEYVESVLSVMETCGMYDSSGRWVYEIGMPAKSGVAGGVVAVLPGQLGIGVFSPRLDSQGNSVRGVRVCRDLSRYLDLHLLNRPAVGRLAIRRRLTGETFGSNRVRSDADTQRLREVGSRIHLYQLQGNLTFSTVEVVLREVLSALPKVDLVILDLRRVLAVNESACHFLHELLQRCEALGKALAFTHDAHLPSLRRFLRRRLGDTFDSRFLDFPDNDRALEWGENRLLASSAGSGPAPGATSGLPAGNDLLGGLGSEDLEFVRSLLVRRPFIRGETLVDAGSTASEMFLLSEGAVSVILDLPDGSERRLASLGPGMTFGEMALLDRSPRSARILAETDGCCEVLREDALGRIERERPAAMLAILRNLCLGFSARLRKANRELLALE